MKGEEQAANRLCLAAVDHIQTPLLLISRRATQKTDREQRLVPLLLIRPHFLSLFISLCFPLAQCGVYVFVWVGGRGMKTSLSRSLPGNVFIFLDPSSSLLRGGVSPLLSPGPHGAL